MNSPIASTIIAAVLLTGFQSVVAAAEGPAPPGAELMETGVVHEALAAPIRYQPRAPVAVPKAPPAAPLEVPPKIAPELQKQATWIPGYWEWDSDTGDFLWVSGVWRFAPPGRKWLQGRWNQSDDGFVRESGSWVPAAAKAVYVEAPPRYKGRFVAESRLEKGQVWVPGCWIPENQEFTWREGFVTKQDKNFVWVPAHYTWADKGWRFVDGYWDYPLPARGQAFASLRFTGDVYDSGEVRIERHVAVPSDAIQETAADEYAYRLEKIDDEFPVSLIAPPDYPVPSYPSPLGVVLPSSGRNASIRGVVRRGELLPEGITVELIGTGVPAVKTNERGEFVFPEVPLGAYRIYAEGPVKNYVRRAFARIEVDEPVEEIELQLR